MIAFEIAQPVEDGFGFLVKGTSISHMSPLSTHQPLIWVKTLHFSKSLKTLKACIFWSLPVHSVNICHPLAIHTKTRKRQVTMGKTLTGCVDFKINIQKTANPSKFIPILVKISNYIKMDKYFFFNFCF